GSYFSLQPSAFIEMDAAAKADLWVDRAGGARHPVDMLRAKTKMRVYQVRTLVLTGLKNDRANLSRQPSFCHFSRTDPLRPPQGLTPSPSRNSTTDKHGWARIRSHCPSVSICVHPW